MLRYRCVLKCLRESGSGSVHIYNTVDTFSASPITSSTHTPAPMRHVSRLPRRSSHKGVWLMVVWTQIVSHTLHRPFPSRTCTRHKWVEAQFAPS